MGLLHRVSRDQGSASTAGLDGIASLLAAIVDSSHDAIVSNTLDGIITSWNPAAERMFGYTAAEAVGQSIRLIIPSDRQAEEDEVLSKVRSGERVDHFETIRQRKDGARIHTSLTVSAIRNAQGVVVGASKIAHDISDRKSLELLLSSIVTSSDDAIISKTLDGIVTSWNTGAEKMFGYASAEVVGKSIRLIIPADRQSEEDFVLHQIRRGEKVDHFETIRQTKDGRMLNISLTVSPVRDAHGILIGASKIARDITVKKWMENELEVTRRQLTEALASRDQFFAVAAHELRNPLSVLSMLWQIPDLSLSGRVIEKSRVQLDRLNSLIDRLLDISRFRAGTLELDRQRLDLGILVREVAGRFATTHPDVQISLQCDPRIEGKWDRLRIDEVLTNVVSNAVKYGLNKPIEVSASANSDEVVVMVRDHGIGISTDDVKRIFEPFERVEELSQVKGLGMGLWITKQVVEAHGGTIRVESEPGHGSTFIVRLPRDRV
jgi:PAS domain S-box-containing protein